MIKEWINWWPRTGSRQRFLVDNGHKDQSLWINMPYDIDSIYDTVISFKHEHGA